MCSLEGFYEGYQKRNGLVEGGVGYRVKRFPVPPPAASNDDEAAGRAVLSPVAMIARV